MDAAAICSDWQHQKSKDCLELSYCCLPSASYEPAAVPGIAHALLSELEEEKKPKPKQLRRFL